MPSYKLIRADHATLNDFISGVGVDTYVYVVCFITIRNRPKSIVFETPRKSPLSCSSRFPPESHDGQPASQQAANRKNKTKTSTHPPTPLSLCYPSRHQQVQQCARERLLLEYSRDSTTGKLRLPLLYTVLYTHPTPEPMYY